MTGSPPRPAGNATPPDLSETRHELRRRRTGRARPTPHPGGPAAAGGSAARPPLLHPSAWRAPGTPRRGAAAGPVLGAGRRRVVSWASAWLGPARPTTAR